jgi:alpha-glucoside transport system substrate-binding protein
MSKLRWRVLLAGLLAAAFAFTACGSDPVEITVTGPERDESEAGAIQAALDAFAEDNDMTITYVGSADWEAEINVAVESDTAPDISIFPQPGKLADFANDGFVVPLSDDTADAVAGNWSQSWLDFGNVDGVQYGVPTKSDLKSLVWYKPARFEALGYSVPETLDEFFALVDQAIADGNTPLCVGIESGQATGWAFTDWVEDMMLRRHGAEVYDQWVANEVKFSDDRVVSVMNEIGDLWSTDGAVFAASGSIAATAFQDNGQPLVDDDCLMHRQASFFSAFIPEGTAFADGSEGAVDVFYFPAAGDDRPVLGAGTLAAGFNDNEETMMVLEYLGSPEYANARQTAQKELKGGGDALSGFLSAVNGADSSLYAPLEASMLEVLATSEVVRFDGSDLMPADVGAGTFWTEGTSFVNGDKSAADAAADIDASWPAG